MNLEREALLSGVGVSPKALYDLTGLLKITYDLYWEELSEQREQIFRSEDLRKVLLEFLTKGRKSWPSEPGLSGDMAKALAERYQFLDAVKLTGANEDGLLPEGYDVNLLVVRDKANDTVIVTFDGTRQRADYETVGFIMSLDQLIPEDFSFARTDAIERYLDRLVAKGTIAKEDVIILSGHSLGGYDSLALRYRRPDLVDAAVTFSTVGFEPTASGAETALRAFGTTYNVVLAGDIVSDRDSVPNLATGTRGRTLVINKHGVSGPVAPHSLVEMARYWDGFLRLSMQHLDRASELLGEIAVPLVVFPPEGLDRDMAGAVAGRRYAAEGVPLAWATPIGQKVYLVSGDPTTPAGHADGGGVLRRRAELRVSRDGLLASDRDGRELRHEGGDIVIEIAGEPVTTLTFTEAVRRQALQGVSGSRDQQGRPHERLQDGSIDVPTIEPRPAPALPERQGALPAPSRRADLSNPFDPGSPDFDWEAWNDRLIANVRARLRAEAPQLSVKQMRNEGRLLLTSAKPLGGERSRYLTVPRVKKERASHRQVRRALFQHFDAEAKRAASQEEKMATGRRYVAALSAARYEEGERARERGWAEATRKDPLLGPNLADNLVTARQALDRFGDRDLYRFLDDSGLANHPAVIRMFYRVGEATADDRFIRPDFTGLPRP